MLSYLYLAVAIYLLWRERNNRLHNPSQGRPAVQLKVAARDNLLISAITDFVFISLLPGLGF